VRLPSASFLLSLRLEFPCDLTNLFNTLSLAVCKRGLEKPRSPDLKSGAFTVEPAELRRARDDMRGEFDAR
jgi:hypothetical protein